MKNTASYEAYEKSPYLSLKHSTYFETYDDLFSKYRGEAITFVEIGVLGGGSLFMWREFFGERARIIGVDRNPEALRWKSEGFEIHIGDQSDEKFWERFAETVGPVDVVLDDGGHTYEQQIVTTEKLLGSIKDGGMLVVEDTHTSYMNGFGPRRFSFIKYVCAMIDNINRRFGELDGERSERRVWSIRIYESMVAFVVDRSASSRISEWTENGGRTDPVEDFRFHGSKGLSRLNALSRSLRPIRRLPGTKKVKDALETAIRNSGFRARRYFE